MRCVIKIVTERLLRVRDIMSSPVRTVRSDARLAHAKEVLATERVSAVAVVAPDGRLVGVVSRTDLCDPRHADDDATVASAMNRVLFAVRPEDPALLAVRLMVREDIHRALVVSEGGALSGIVTAMDVMRAIANDGGGAPSGEAELVRVGH